MDCYGIKHNRTANCKSCDLASYCKDAQYPSAMTSQAIRDNEAIINSIPAQAVVPEIDKNTVKEAASLVSEIFNTIESNSDRTSLLYLISDFTAIQDKNPKRVDILLQKILHPYLSVRDIAAKLKTCRTSVQYHLSEVKRQYPRMSSAILIDRRFIPHHRPVKAKSFYQAEFNFVE